MIGTNDSKRVENDHLYVCQYNGQETILVGKNIKLWNEGLDEGLTARRSLGCIIHSWAVTEAGFQEIRMDYVTDAGVFVMIPTAIATRSQPIIVEDADPTLQLPSELFSVSHINAAVRGAAPNEVTADADDLDELGDDVRAVAGHINDGIEAEFESRYENWRAGQEGYPRGKDYGYQIPLDAEWKHRVVADRTNLSAAQVELLSTAGFPTSMRVTVNVTVPDAVEEELA